MQTQARIVDIAGHLPEQILTNAELAALYPEWSAERILEKTGIAERHIADPDETAADLAFQAAMKLFERGTISPEDVDFLILCTQAPDYVLPTTACLLQHRLGIPPHSGALDINLGCSGYVYGLSLAKGLIETGAARNVLFLTADTYSKIIHPLDKSVRTLFGDGATATLVSAGKPGDTASIGPFVFGTDGSGANHLIVKAGGFRDRIPCPRAEVSSTLSGSEVPGDMLYMNGPAIMEFSLSAVPKAIDALSEKMDARREQIDFFVLHQANKFMLEALRKKLKIEPEKFPIYLEGIGNTVSSTIPFTLAHLLETGKISEGSRLVLAGFGVGLSYAAAAVTF